MSPGNVGHVGEGSWGWCWSCFAQDRVWVCAQKYLHITVYKSLK